MRSSSRPMKRIPRICAALIACLLIPSATFAEDEVSDYEVLNKYPTLSEGELKQVLFTGTVPENISPRGVSWELHNPFRDKSVAGLVINIEWKSPANQTISLDLFVRTNSIPLSSASGHEAFFKAEEAMKANPRISLKEVRYAAVVK